MDDALLMPLVGGVLLAVLAGPYGCMVVWQRLAYFSETIAHSALLGIALGTAITLPSPLAIAMVAGCIALVMVGLRRETRFSNDGVLGLLAHASLAFGLVFLSMQEGGVTHDDHHHTIDPHALEAMLFGDLMGIGAAQLPQLAMVVMVLLGAMILWWKRLLRRVLDATISTTLGECPVRTDAVFTLLLALVVAFSFQWVGILLITSLLIIPALAARLLAASPTQMAWLSSSIAVFSVVSGIFLADHLSLPTTPSIVVVATCVFVCLYVVKSAKPR